MKKKIFAVILTGGVGDRVALTSGLKIPKQLLPILGKPLFIHCIEIYRRLEKVDRIYLVINDKFKRLYVKLLFKYGLGGKIELVRGGATRLASIMNAVDAIKETNGVVILHNGSSPATRAGLIDRCIGVASKKGAVTAYVPAFFTTFVSGKGQIRSTLKRSGLGYTCDPQVYDIGILREALRLARRRRLNDASTVELAKALGKRVYLVRSGDDNIKITTEPDLKAAEFILKKRKGRSSNA